MKKIFLVIATYLLCASLNAQSFEYLESGSFCYGHENQEGDFFVLSSNDYSNSNILKLSSKGDSLWKKSYPMQPHGFWRGPIIMEGLDKDLLFFYSHSLHHSTPYCDIKLLSVDSKSGDFVKEDVLPNEPVTHKIEEIFDPWS